MKPEFSGVQHYRESLTEKLSAIKKTEGPDKARNVLRGKRGTIAYKLSRMFHRQPDVLKNGNDKSALQKVTYRGSEEEDFGFYRSNEFAAGLAPEVQGLGGVGLTVGSDQGLDFFTMAGLCGLYMIDIDPYTHIVNRSYLETGARFHKMFGRYPTTTEFIRLFQEGNWSLTLDMLAAPSTTYKFHKRDIDWLRQRRTDSIPDYLKQKKKYYQGNSWISSDASLKRVIQTYEEGRIIVCQGSIVGDLIPRIAKQVENRGEHVTLIYTSNAPVKDSSSLRVWTLLPINQKTRVICSGGGLEGVPLYDYGYAGYWTFIVFRLMGASIWPNPYAHGEYSYEEITPGCYRAKPKKKQTF